MQRNFVNAGGLFMFRGPMPPDFIADALTSHLFYQLAASGQHDPFSDAEAWRLEYIQVMLAFGQEISRTEVQSIPIGGPESLWSVIKSVLGKQISPGQLSQVEATFTHLRNDDDTSLKVFEQYTTQPLTGEIGNSAPETPLPAVTTEENQAPRAVVLQLAFVDTVPFLTQVFLSFKTTCSSPILSLISQEQVVGNLELNLITAEFDVDTYENIRETVLEMLGPRRSSLIIELGEVAS
jgi:hypothetical protein